MINKYNALTNKSLIKQSEENYFTLNVNNPISAVCLDKDNTAAVIGGREILKYVEINQNEKKFVIKKNMRIIKKIHVTYLEFQNYQNWVAAAGFNGAIMVFDISDKFKISFEVKAHDSCVNKLNWNPKATNLFISGSQDGCVKIWDAREQTTNAIMELQRADAVRDVKYHPSNPDYFLVSYDSGSLERSILSIDWNNNDNSVFATGSMDKDIKIWQLDNFSYMKEITSIKNLGDVSYVKWRKKNWNEFCIASYSLDNAISVWDIEKKHYPRNVFKGHRDVVTAFDISKEDDWILSVSKDCHMIFQTFENAFSPFQHCNKLPVAFNKDGDIAFQSCRQDKASSIRQSFSNQKQVVHDDIEHLRYIEEGTNQVKFLKSFEFALKDDKLGLALSQQELEYVATKCITKGLQLQEMCRINSEVYKTLDKHEIARLWEVLPYFVQDSINAQINNSQDKSILELNTNLMNQELNKPINDKYNSKINSMDYSVQQNSNIKIDDRDNDLHQKDELEIRKGEEFLKFLEKYPDKAKKGLKNGDIILQDDDIYIKKEFYEEIKDLFVDKTKENLLKYFKEWTLNSDEINLINQQTLVKTIQDIVDFGELQAAFIIYLTLQPWINVPEKQLMLWTHSYIEILRSQELYALSNEIRRISPIEKIKSVNKKDTIFHSKCSRCKGVLELNSRGICSKCKDFSSYCSICKMPIKGLMIWCQVCGHCGHIDEYKQWFSENEECPALCGHKCFVIKNLNQ